MGNDLVCPICGEPTRVYMGNARKDRLCAKHADMLKRGELALDEDGKPKLFPSAEEVKQSGSQSELTCIICGQISNGKHFCYTCYQKYKDRAVDIRISHCKEVIILDEYGSAKFKCKDGRKVRSKSEKIISDFLFDHRIIAIYEKEVYYYPDPEDTSKPPIILHPDFYIPDHELYIEHNGLSHYSYKANKAKTEAMYKKMGLKVIVTIEEDMEDIEKKLKPILRIN